MSWKAKLQLSYRQQKAQTYLASVQHEGPFLVQKSFVDPSSATLQSYLLHPPGGLVGGDELHLSAHLHPGSSVLLTTPAAGKIYRTPADGSRFRAELRLEAESSLFYLPQENIIFEGAHHRSQLQIDLGEQAAASLWDISCLGRPGAGESFGVGHLFNEILVNRDSRPCLIERVAWQGGDALLQEPWGLAGQTVVGSLILAWPRWPDLSSVLGDLSEDAVQAGASFRNGIYILRARTDCAFRLRALFLKTLESLLNALDTRPPQWPRIWAY